MPAILKSIALLFCLLVFGCAQLEKGYQDTKKAIFPEDAKPKSAAKAPEAKKAPEAEKPKEPPAPPPPPKEPAPAPAKPSGEEFILHKVAGGETLAVIAKWYCGKTSFWREIAACNPGLDPTRLKEGQIIKIPAAIATVHKEPPGHSPAAGPGPKKITRDKDKDRDKDKEKDKEASEGPPAPESKPVFGPK